MNELTIFNYEDKEIRTQLINNEPWFVGKDVAEILGYSNPPKAIRDHIDDEDKRTERIVHPLGGEQDTYIINESGLYSLILSSKLEGAKNFKRWVTSEVLPTIRKHGAYMTNDTLEKALTSPEFLIQLATNLKIEKEKNKMLTDKIETDKPRVSFAETIEKASSCILIREFSKVLGNEHIHLGEKKLYQRLREWGYIFQNSTEPTQRAIQQGLFKINERIVKTVKGDIISKTTLLTGKGQVFLLEKFKKEYNPK